MKNSTKFILIVLAAIVVLFVVLTFMVRNIVSDHLVIDRNQGQIRVQGTDNEGERVEKEYNFNNFNKIEVAGGWDILVIKDDQYRVTVDYYESDDSEYKISSSGGKLKLGMENLKLSNRIHGASATIYMPQLNNVEVEGAVNMNIEGFSVGELNLSLDGAGSFTGEDCKIDNFSLDSNGAVNVNFDASDIENAKVYLGGAGNVQLHMTGGVLEGRLEGLSNLEYSGEVSRLDVEKDGIGNIGRSE